MRKILILITATLIATPNQTPACGDYRRVLPKMRTVPAQGLQRLTSETFQYYLGKDGKEIRHGFSSQFDSAGNLIGRARYVDGKIWSGSLARVFLSCGIGASRSHFVDGKEVSRETLDGKPVREGDTIGFAVNPDQIFKIAARERPNVHTSKLARR